jgi:hypothetical protein
MRREALDLYRQLHGGLTDQLLSRWTKPRLDLFASLDWVKLKATLVDELLAGYREALTSAGGTSKQLLANAFPPPFSTASGIGRPGAARHADGLCVKLYTMHWPMMLRFYGDALREANPGVSERLLVRALASWFDISDGPGFDLLSDYRYPEPDEPHPAGLQAQRRKIVAAQRAAGATPVYALAHGYGPLEDYRRRLRAAFEAAGSRVWINRYGYLSDAKLSATGELARG